MDPNSFDIQNGGSQSFNFTVSDGNGNPMSSGQTISVKVNKGDLEITGDVNVSMLDTQSKTFTMFSFTASDSKPDTTKLQQAIIDISTSGPNGDKKISVYGTKYWDIIIVLLLGFLSLLQIIWLPGFLILKAFKLRTNGFIQIYLYTFGISLSFNYFLVCTLVFLKIYVALTIFIIFFIEILIFIYFLSKERSNSLLKNNKRILF